MFILSSKHLELQLIVWLQVTYRNSIYKCSNVNVYQKVFGICCQSLLTGYGINRLASSKHSGNGNKSVVSDWCLHDFVIDSNSFVLYTFTINYS